MYLDGTCFSLAREYIYAVYLGNAGSPRLIIDLRSDNDSATMMDLNVAPWSSNCSVGYVAAQVTGNDKSRLSLNPEGVTHG